MLTQNNTIQYEYRSNNRVLLLQYSRRAGARRQANTNQSCATNALQRTSYKAKQQQATASNNKQQQALPPVVLMLRRPLLELEQQNNAAPARSRRLLRKILGCEVRENVTHVKRISYTMGRVVTPCSGKLPFFNT